MDYAKQQTMMYYHWTPQQYDEQNYFDLQYTLSAEKPEEHNIDVFSQFGLPTSDSQQ